MEAPELRSRVHVGLVTLAAALAGASAAADERLRAVYLGAGLALAYLWLRQIERAALA